MSDVVGHSSSRGRVQPLPRSLEAKLFADYFAKVEEEITAVNAKVEEAELQAKSAGSVAERDYWRKEKEQLRDKEKTTAVKLQRGCGVLRTVAS